MGRGVKGKNGEEFEMTYGAQWVFLNLLKLLLGKDVDFDVTVSEAECKEWAAVLRSNIERMRLLTIEGTKFAMLEGMDVHELFSKGAYSDWGRQKANRLNMVKEAPVEPLNEFWRDYFLEFIDFLESCGGFGPSPPYP